MTIHRKAAFLLAVAAGAALATPASAAVYLREWKDPHGGSFASRDNWIQGVPRSSDIVIFDLAGAYTISFPSNRASSGMVIGRDKLVLDLNGHQYRVVKGNGKIILGSHVHDISRMSVTDGKLLSRSALLANALSSTATVTVTSGGQWTPQNLLTIGNKGRGILNITDGGEVFASTVRVGSGAKSKGSILLTSPGSLLSAKTLSVGSDAGAKGSIVLSHGASLQTSSRLINHKRGTIQSAGGEVSGLFENYGNFISNAAETHILGEFRNEPGAIVSVTGAHITFDGPVIHNGASFWVGPNSTALFNDIVSGAKPFTGGGLLQFHGSYSPGNSPAHVHDVADLDFGSTGELILDVGTSSDLLSVTGSVALHDIFLSIPNPSSILGQPITVLTATNGITFTGQESYHSNLPSGYQLQVDLTPTQLSVTVVPEPATLSLLSLSALALLRRQRRRS